MLCQLQVQQLETGTGLFGLAVSVTGLFSLGQNLTCSLFNANLLKSTKGFIQKSTNMIQDATVHFFHQQANLIIIDILQLNTNTHNSLLQFRFNHNHDSSKGSLYNTS